MVDPCLQWVIVIRIKCPIKDEVLLKHEWYDMNLLKDMRFVYLHKT